MDTVDSAITKSVRRLEVFTGAGRRRTWSDEYSSGVGRLVELQVSGEDLALRLALRSVDAGRGYGRG